VREITRPGGCQGPVRAEDLGVKNASMPSGQSVRGCRLSAVPVAGRRFGLVREGGGAPMADVLYVALLIGVFLVLALTLRGLERL
jgi:hypothetical protein